MRRTKSDDLRAWGLMVGKRDPQRNTAFKGKFMVAEPISDAGLMPTTDARHGGYCIVGDNLDALVTTAHAWFGEVYPHRCDCGARYEEAVSVLVCRDNDHGREG